MKRGTTITIHDLPTPNQRWSPDRKKLVLKAIALGVVTLEWAQARYQLTIEEFLEWRRKYMS